MKLQKAYGAFLSQWRWDHFVTLTFASPPGDGRIRAEFDRWIRRLERLSRRRVDYFVAFERGQHGNLLHIHALTLGTGSVAPFGLGAAWKAGKCDVRVYDWRQGAAYYVAKVVESDGDYAFSAKLEVASAG